MQKNNTRIIDFIKISKYSIYISVVLIVLGIGSLIVNKGLRLGVDFAGGKELRLAFTNNVTISRELLESNLKSIGIAANITQIHSTDNKKEFFIYYPSRNDSQKPALVNQFNKAFGASNWSIITESFVGPKIGKQFTQIAVYSSIITLILLLIYIGFRFQFWFGIAALLALVHDIIITVCFISLDHISFDIPILAALLTIIGYSLNDTIVIFDRIRNEKLLLEDHPTIPHYYKLLNVSINKSLTRTILTAGTTLSVLLILYFVGGDQLKPMSLVLVFGVVIGTISSNVIAPPVLYLRYRNQYKKNKN